MTKVVGRTDFIRRAGICLAIGLLAALAGFVPIAQGEISSGDRNVYVPLPGCRLFDTRPSHVIGTVSGALGPGVTMTVVATGASGHCNLPTTATTIVLTLTAINPTNTGGLQVFPANQNAPARIDLRFAAHQKPVSTQVTVGLSVDGKIKVKNTTGSVQVIGDVTGYYTTHDHDDRYFTKAEADSRFFAGSTVVLVPADGTPQANGAALVAALAGITDASTSKRYTVRMAGGLYDLGNAGLDVPSFIELQGSGEEHTVLTSPGQQVVDATLGVHGTLRMSGETTLRQLTVFNHGGLNTSAIAVRVADGSVSMVDVTIRFGAGSVSNFGIAPEHATVSRSLDLSNVHIVSDLAGSDPAFGIGQVSATDKWDQLTVRNSSIDISGSGGGVQADATLNASSAARIADTAIDVNGGGTGVRIRAQADLLLQSDVISVSGSQPSNTGVLGIGGFFHPTIMSTAITVSGGTSTNDGIAGFNIFSFKLQGSRVDVSGTASTGLHLGNLATDTATVFVDSSLVSSAGTAASVGGTASTVRFGASQLAAPTLVTAAAGASVACVASYKSNYTALSATCT